MQVKKQKEIPFTKEAYQKLKDDEARLQQKRKEVLVRLKTAREMGDLSENGAYKYAKFEISSINRQLRHVAFLLKSAKIKESKGGTSIDFGSTVTLESTMGKRIFMLVSGYESDPLQNKLSMHSPLGKLLVHKQVGDAVTVQAPAGKIHYTITKVS